ncbi:MULTISPECIES: SIMPL domain-containing protein [Mumia]|uniref:SIMPL domain-containing protein n=1 Tax=Mumia TaxID=1546255 RepID=UPI0014226B76|nr:MULTISPECIES: SIMPL domain-containing protein [unclassified Mumia]QMW66779.1 SIMPL domain-containing protein [Mumia sp. ZJ1417]
MPRITVAGRATQSHPAERGTVQVLVSFAGERRADVVARSEQAHASLVEQAKDAVAGGAATWWGADQVAAFPYDEWIKPSAHEDQIKVRRFRTNAAIHVKFADFAALSSWVGAVSLEPGVTIRSIDWALTEAHRDRVVAEVRAAAALDAVTRAQAYADALGLGPVRLTALYEDGLRPHIGSGGAPGPGVAMRAAAGGGGNGGGFELQPDDIDVTAVVTADFEAGATI